MEAYHAPKTNSSATQATPKVVVIIPNWNGLDFIEECLRALERQTIPHHVIVVDNGSADGSPELVAAKFPKVELLRFADNAGFTGGVNHGLEPALKGAAEYLVLLNNDAVPEPDWLEKLVERAEREPDVGIVTSKIRHMEDNRLDSTGDFYSTWGFPFPRGRDEVDEGQYDSPEQQVVFGASGGASLYRAEMLRQIGLFDQRFFAYFEDIDVSFRAQLAGWQVRYEPSAVVRHHISATSARISVDGQSEAAAPAAEDRPSAFARYHTVKNFAYVYTKDMPGWLYWKYLPLWWASWAMMLVSDVRRGLLSVNVRANAVALRRLPGILLDRWRIQRGRKVSLAYVDSILYHDLPPLQKLRFRRFKRFLPWLNV